MSCTEYGEGNCISFIREDIYHKVSEVSRSSSAALDDQGGIKRALSQEDDGDLKRGGKGVAGRVNSWGGLCMFKHHVLSPVHLTTEVPISRYFSSHTLIR